MKHGLAARAQSHVISYIVIICLTWVHFAALCLKFRFFCVSSSLSFILLSRYHFKLVLLASSGFLFARLAQGVL